jgi:peptidoglycan/xylan/chitin deacetylase (PgdA/CDA1 family)
VNPPRKHSVRQLVIGLLALPLSLLPFWAYLTYTQEGRLVRDRALVAVNPPELPHLSADEVRRGVVPAYRGAVMVLAYHGIGTLSDGEGGFVVPPDRFGEHLVAMQRAGMHPVTASEVADAFAGGKPLPSRAVMITFDDGRSDAIMYADPLLKQAHMKATMFVITSAASRHGIYYADWGRLERAAESGRWDLQSHTDAAHHMQEVDGEQLPALTSRRDGESLDAYRTRVRRDFARADRAIKEHVGKDPVALAYPFGAYGADRTNDARIAATLRSEVARKYALAFQQDDQDTIALATPYDDRTALRRLEVADWTASQLIHRISEAAARTEAVVAAQQAALQQQLDAGGELPPGVTGAPTPIRQRASRGSAPRSPVTSSAPAAPAAAPPPAYTSPDDTPTPPPRERPTPTTEPPSTPPPSSPPDTTPPSNNDDSPGKSDEPHGNGHGKP